MSKISVYLRLSKKSHPLYEELTNHPPKGVVYNFSQKVEHYSRKESRKQLIKQFLWNNFTKIMPPFLPIKTSADVIHSTNNILPISKKPFLFDTESEYGMFQFDNKNSNSRIYTSILKKYLLSNNCKKILAWSNICKSNLSKIFGTHVSSKIEVVYPAHHIPKVVKKSKSNTKVRLLFVSRKFEYKGVYELLDAFDMIKDEYDCELEVISDIPPSIINKYKHDEKVRLIHSSLDRDELSKHFSQADIFVYPSRMDTFGFVIIEAMAHKLPVISTKIYAIPEIVKDGKTGILIEPLMRWGEDIKDGRSLSDVEHLKEYHRRYLLGNKHFIRVLADKMELLIKNKKLRLKMGNNGFMEVKKGKFSIGYRNKRLKKIYEEALL